MIRANRRSALLVISGVLLTVVCAVVVSLVTPLSLPDSQPSARSKAFLDSVLDETEWGMDRPQPRYYSSKMGYKVAFVFGSLESDSHSVGETRYSPVHEYAHVEAGFPLKSFSGQVHRRDNQVIGQSWSVPLEENGVQRMVIVPLKPIWLPFIANVFFWSLISFLAWKAYRRFKAKSDLVGQPLEA